MKAIKIETHAEFKDDDTIRRTTKRVIKKEKNLLKRKMSLLDREYMHYRDNNSDKESRTVGFIPDKPYTSKYDGIVAESKIEKNKTKNHIKGLFERLNQKLKKITHKKKSKNIIEKDNIENIKYIDIPQTVTEYCMGCNKKFDSYKAKFNCSYCGGFYCSDCRLPENHNCIGKLKSPPHNYRVQYSKGRIKILK